MPAATTSRPRRADQGSALLIVIFFAAVMIISAAAATTSVLTQGRREKEEDLIWRGNQYARAVKLFYRKNGRFPQSMDDLTKKQNNIRYLRRAYEDPMNTEDGTWRLIYVGPGGQLIGSTRMGGMIGMPQARPGATGTPVGAPTGVGVPAIPAAPATGTQPGGTTGTLGSGPIMGGNIIGVGSKVPKGSIKVYNGSQIYREWEFIWDPARDAMQSGQPGVGGPQPGTPAGQPPGGPQIRPPRQP